jgi:hypothetical protein
VTNSILDHMIPHFRGGKTDAQFKSILNEISCFVFDRVFSVFTIEGEAKQVVMYILYAYSKESPMLIFMADSEKEKEGICRNLNIPDYLANRLITLDSEIGNDPILMECINDFLEMYAPQDWRTLQFLKMQVSNLQREVNTKSIVDKDKVWDVNQ